MSDGEPTAGGTPQVDGRSQPAAGATQGAARTAAGAGGPGRLLAGAAVAVATALVIAGVTIALFFNPAWVSFAQARADAAAWTGWTQAQVDEVTRDVVLEVWLGPGTFEQQLDGQPVFSERERSHMADVRRVVLWFYAAVLLGAAALLVAGLASRGSPWFWRAVGTGAKVLAVGTIAVGVAFFLLFDTAFALFHQLFFAEGAGPSTRRPIASCSSSRTSSGRRPPWRWRSSASSSRPACGPWRNAWRARAHDRVLTPAGNPRRRRRRRARIRGRAPPERPSSHGGATDPERPRHAGASRRQPWTTVRSLERSAAA